MADQSVLSKELQGKSGQSSNTNGNSSSRLSRSRSGSREEWTSKLDYMMSCVGFAVGLGNLWRFPYLCYKNGGGAFLVPYLVCVALAGVPVFFLENTLGQMLGQGVLSVWIVCPVLKGIGYATVIMNFWMNYYYIVVIAWAVFYFYSSFHAELPWATCEHPWNTVWCRNDEGNLTDSTNYTNPVQEFWENRALEISPGIEHIGKINGHLALCLACSWFICWFMMIKGLKWSGKLIYITTVFPYLCMVILFVRGITLDGASLGIKYYLMPRFGKLLDANVWNDAATQIFFSYGLGLGVWTALSSYHKYHNRHVLRDTLIISIINTTTSLFAGLIVFSIVGYMAKSRNKPIEQVAVSGSGLVFIVYPHATANMPFSPFWAVLFFAMVITLGIGSQVVQLEGFVTALLDEFPNVLRPHRQVFLTVTIFMATLLAFIFVSQSGIYWFELFNYYAASGFALLSLIFFEMIAVSWIYGNERYVKNVEAMLQIKLSQYWKLCWLYFTPILCLLIFIFSLLQYKPIEYKNYQYPNWAIGFGWFLALTSMLCIPLYALHALLTSSGSLSQRWQEIKVNYELIDQIIEMRQVQSRTSLSGLSSLTIK